MAYLCKFDDDGKRIATAVEGVHFTTKKEKKAYIDQGYIETSSEDYTYYVGNKGTGKNGTGYVRGADGQPTDAPALTPTKEEKSAELDAQYEADKAEIVTAYQTAAIYGDTARMEKLKADLSALDDKYDADYDEIEGAK